MDLRERDAAGDPGDVRRHPWESARAGFFAGLVAELAAARPAAAPVRRLLDVGAGDDWLGRSLVPVVRAHGAPDATVTCWDVHYPDADLAAPTPDGIIRTAAPPEGPFDLVTALDVLEHVADEDAFLASQVADLLAPGGEAIISVPAYMVLYGDHDRMLGHVRRYRPGELRRVVERHLDVVDAGPLFTSLLLPRAAQVGLERLGRHGDETGVGEWAGSDRLTRILEALLRADAAAGRRLRRLGVPVPGLSTWVIGRNRR